MQSNGTFPPGPLQASYELTVYINMLGKNIMFRLHIVRCGLRFCGRIWILPIDETLC